MVRQLATTRKRKVKSQDDVSREFYRLVKERFPGIPENIEKVIYRKPSGLINARIIDPSFASTELFERDLLLADVFANLPSNFEHDLGILLLFTPEEAKGSMSYMMPAFDDPFGDDD